MRHVTIRGILALIWLAAAIVSGLSGNLGWAGLLPGVPVPADRWIQGTRDSPVLFPHPGEHYPDL